MLLNFDTVYIICTHGSYVFDYINLKVSIYINIMNNAIYKCISVSSLKALN